MILPKHKYLLTYRYSEIIHDLTVKFIKRYILSNLGNLMEKPKLPEDPEEAANFLLLKLSRFYKRGLLYGKLV